MARIERNGYAGQNRGLNNPIANKIRVIREKEKMLQNKVVRQNRNLADLHVKNDQNQGIQYTYDFVFKFLKETISNKGSENSKLTNSFKVLLQNFNLLDNECIKKTIFSQYKVPAKRY